MKRRSRDPIHDLMGVEWLGDLRPGTLRTLGRHVDRCDLPAGARLQRRDMRVRWLWVVIDGTVVVRDAHHDPIVLVRGTAWGEVEIVLGRPSSVDVVTETPATVLSIPSEVYHGLLADPMFASGALQRLAAAVVHHAEQDSLSAA